MTAFYRDVLGLRVTDRLADEGTWLHCNADHHTVALVGRGYAHFHHLALDRAGMMAAIFADWQSCSDDGHELVDPIQSQYREFFLVVEARWEGRSRSRASAGCRTRSSSSTASSCPSASSRR